MLQFLQMRRNRMINMCYNWRERLLSCYMCYNWMERLLSCYTCYNWMERLLSCFTCYNWRGRWRGPFLCAVWYIKYALFFVDLTTAQLGQSSRP